jgi:hypothetical protein
VSNKWVIPYPSKDALIDHLAKTMRDRAFPEFGQSPTPLWATDAARTIADFYEDIAKAAVTYGGADRAHRLLHSALRWTEYLEEPTPAVRDAWIAAAKDELGAASELRETLE